MIGRALITEQPQNKSAHAMSKIVKGTLGDGWLTTILAPGLTAHRTDALTC